jgi:hypothetical protein
MRDNSVLVVGLWRNGYGDALQLLICRNGMENEGQLVCVFTETKAVKRVVGQKKTEMKIQHGKKRYHITILKHNYIQK